MMKRCGNGLGTNNNNVFIFRFSNCYVSVTVQLHKDRTKGNSHNDKPFEGKCRSFGRGFEGKTMRKYNDFDYSYLIKDKTKNINTFCKFMLCKSQGMFVYSGLPDTLPACELERYIQTRGHVTIAEHKGDIYAFDGSLQGEHLSPYAKPTQSLVTNVALNMTKTFEDGKDCVIGYNDSYGLGVAPIYAKFGYMLCETRLTQYNILILTRAQQLFSASDSNTVASAQIYLKKLIDGELSVIAENAFFEGLKTHNDNASIASNLKTLIEFEQYLKASCLNEIGLNANWNAKREALNSSETGMNEASLLPFPIDMLKQRQTMVEAVNSLFGLNITVELNEIWRQDELDKGDKGDKGNLASDGGYKPADENMGIGEQETNPDMDGMGKDEGGPDSDSPTDERSDEPSDEPTDEPSDERSDEPAGEPSDETKRLS